MDNIIKNGLNDIYSDFDDLNDIISNKSKPIDLGSSKKSRYNSDSSDNSDMSDSSGDVSSDYSGSYGYSEDDEYSDVESVYSNASNASSVLVTTLGQDAKFADAYRNNQHQNFITDAQKKRDCIRNVVNNLETVKHQTVYNLEKEQEEDMKLHYIADIKIYMNMLEEDGRDINIDIPDINSTYKEVKQVHRILQRMTDHQRYCSFANEFIIFGANCLEYIFDGKKEYFGYKPDLTDWSVTVQSKLPRMKADTTKIVSNFVQGNNIHPLFRIGLELVPSAITHSKVRASQYGESDMYTNSRTSGNAINSLNNSYY